MVGCQYTSCQIPQIAECLIFGTDFGWAFFVANSGHICGQGATLWCRNRLVSPNKSVQGHLRAPDRAERAILGVIGLGIVLPIQAVFVVGEPLCDVGTPS